MFIKYVTGPFLPSFDKMQNHNAQKSIHGNQYPRCGGGGVQVMGNEQKYPPDSLKVGGREIGPLLICSFSQLHKIKV